MGKNKTWIQVLILAVVAVIGGIAIGQSLFFKEEIPKEGSKAPAFSLAASDNSKHELSNYKGKVVVVNFWGTFCEPCKDEMPAIQHQYDKWKSKGVEVLGINLGESRITVQSFMRDYGVTFPVLFDPDLKVRDKYGVSLYPTTFFLNRDGKVEKLKIGEMDEAFIDQTLAEMVSNQ